MYIFANKIACEKSCDLQILVILSSPFSTTLHSLEYVSVIDRNIVFRRRWKLACTWCPILIVSISRSVTFRAITRYNVALVTCSYHLNLQTRKLSNVDECLLVIHSIVTSLKSSIEKELKNMKRGWSEMLYFIFSFFFFKVFPKRNIDPD